MAITLTRLYKHNNISIHPEGKLTTPPQADGVLPIPIYEPKRTVTDGAKPDMQKPQCFQQCLRTRAMASEKLGIALVYQAAYRMGSVPST